MLNFVLLAAVASVLPFPRELKIGGGFVKNPAVVESRDATLPPEGYRLSVGPNGAKIVASDDRGAFYARETLRQLGGDRGVPCCEAKDWPAYPMRVIQIDEGRHFFGKPFILKTLELMARYKLNTLHWHLCEDQGWRLPVDKYPNLTTIGATRPRTALRGYYTGRYDNVPYGPYAYTKAEVREILVKAKELHVDVIPEIEMPGHSRSIVAAYPELGCPDHPLAERTCWTDWGICDDVVCASNPKTLQFYKDVIDEVCELFPDAKVIHMGGDEVTPRNWSTCPNCRKLMKELGYTDPMRLQGYLTEEIMKYLRAKGRKYMGYAACVTTGAKVDKAWTIVESGCGEQGQVLASEGYQVVQGPTEYCYWDFEQCLPDDPCVYGTWWAGANPLNQVYSFNPAAGVAPAMRRNVLGGVGFNWSEYTYSARELEWKVWPRAIALAQALWNPQGGYSYQEQFVPALKPHLARLRAEGVNAAPVPPRGRVASTGGANADNQAVD